MQSPHTPFAVRFAHLIARVLIALSLLGTTFAAHAQAPLIYAYKLNNHLISFSASNPGSLLTDIALTGLTTGEYVAGIDFRPATGELFGTTINDAGVGRIVKINVQTGSVTQVGATTLSLSAADFFGVGFNPVVDRLRVVASSGANLRINPDTAAVFTDTNLSYAAGDVNAASTPTLAHVAYTNSFSGATETAMYGIDTALHVLVKVPSPNDGKLTTVGTLGVNLLPYGGFDIQPGTDIAYAALRVATDVGSSLHTINLNTGAATRIGPIGGGGFNVDGLAIATPPSPCLDLDGDGVVNPLTDGLILLRALLGMTGTAVTANALPTPTPPRSTWSAIQQHMNANCGMRFAQ